MIVQPNQVEDVLNRLRGQPKLCFDTETTGLSQTDRAFGLAIATEKEEFYFDNRVVPNVTLHEIIKNTHALTMVAQNAKFDLRMIEGTWGAPMYAWVEDTEVLARIVRNDHLSYSLDAQAKREGMEKFDSTKEYIKKNKLHTDSTTRTGETVRRLHFDKVPLEIMAPYAANDARITFDLHTKYQRLLDPRSIPVWQTEKALTQICYRMERKGIKVNEKYTSDAYLHCAELIRECKNNFKLFTGVDYDNKKTTLVDIFTKAGEVIPKTDKGNDQLTDEVLSSFKSPIAKLVQETRSYEKMLSTYYSSYLDLMDDDCIIHPDMRQAGTTTGRFSYREPNLQNIPADEDSEDLFVPRACFMPRAGKVFVAMDYKQQEYVLMLAYAKHHTLIKQVMDGADVHQAMADMVGIQRREAKTLNFACLYGAGPAKISGMLKIDLDAATRLRQKYFSRLREVEVLIKEVTRIGKARGYIYNWAGRKLFVNHPDFSYKFPNYLIQGGGADICKKAMVECDEILGQFDADMVLQIHDALYFEMTEADMPVLIPKLVKAMQDVFPEKNGITMKVDVKWSAKSLAERDMNKWI